MAIPRKGLKDIKTMSGGVDRVHLPHRAYFKVGCLELEKTRRNRERQSAQESISRIDTRLHKVEEEKKALLETLGDLEAGREPPKPVSPRPPRVRGFKIEY